MIRIVLAQRADGVDLAHTTIGDREINAATRNGVSMKLARMLMADGVPDQPWEAYGHDGKLRMRGPSIFAWAKWTMSETDQGLRRVPYRENPRFPVQRDAPDGFSS